MACVILSYVRSDEGREKKHNETSKLEHLYAVTLAYLEQSLYDHVEDMNETTLAYLGQSVHDGHGRGVVFALLCAIFQ